MSGIPTVIFSLLLAFSLSFGAYVDEYIENTCPDDPTFGGKCSLVNKTVDGQGCKTIDGVEICRDWWEKEYTYECEGTDRDALYSTFLGQGYCRAVTVCKQWEDVSLSNGDVSCRVYLDKNRPGCDSNPNKPECIADDCGDIREKCNFKEYIYYGDLPDGANTTSKYTCDTYGTTCGYVQVSGISGVSLGTYVYECPSDVRKVCREYETKIRCPATCPDGTQVSCPDTSNQATCPDGTFVECPEQACNTVKTCKNKKQITYETTELKSCNAPRGYTEYRVEAGSQQAEDLANNPSCVKISDEITPCSYATRTYGNTTICELAGRHSAIGGDSGQVFIGRDIKVPDGTDLVLYVYTGNSCDDDNTRVDAFFKDSITKNILGEKHTSCSVNGQVYTLYSNTQNLTIDYKLKIVHCIGSGCGSNDTTFSDTETSTSWNNGGSTWDSHDSSLGWKIYHWETYRCYNNTVDTSSCDTYKNKCTLIDNLSDLSNLACIGFDKDINNPNKQICSEYAVQYECPTTVVEDKCLQWETSQVCNSAVFPIKDVTIENKDFTDDFAQATALAQFSNELKHIWSGKWMRCDSGWWSSAFENPFEFFKQRLIGFAISQLGSQFLSAATTFVSDYIGQCASPSYSADGISSCLAAGASQAWSESSPGSGMQDFLKNVGFDPNSPVMFLASPYGQFALQTALAIIMSTEKCNACTSKRCAEKHGQYDTYGLIKGGNCFYVENGCAWKIKYGFGSTCLRKKYMYCCYDSVFSRILVKEAYKQLGYSFSGGNCSAITFDDIKKLDFSSMDWTELQQYVEKKMKGQINPELIQNKINDYFSGGEYGNQTFTGETPY